MSHRFTFINSIILLASILISAQSAAAQEVQVKPWFLIIVDTSYSMISGTGNNLGSNTCGFDNTQNEGTKLAHAKCALNRLVAAIGDATFGLMKFSQTSSCSGNVCDTSANSGQMLVNLYEDNQNAILTYVDDSGNCGNELIINGLTWTPLQGSLTLARNYFCQGSPGASPTCGTAPSPFNVSPTNSDSDIIAECRPISVILLTDGDETCGGTPANAATALRTTRIPISGGYITKDIRTYVIGFGISAGDTDIEAIANAGGTDAPGPNRGFYATDETSLALAFSQIIADSQLIEVCDGEDNDCDGLTDEGFPGLGNGCSAGVGACLGTGTIICDPDDVYSTICDATEGTPSPENTPAACQNDVDDDCDGLTDCDGPDPDCVSIGICACAALPEVCDGDDNDCDGEIDNIPGTTDPLTRQCGVDLGICDFGTETCVDGSWQGCTADPQPGDVAETCNDLDDDCDGITDGMVEDCSGNDTGACDPGERLCTAGDWGSCYGLIEPSVEICDGIDSDCDGVADENDTDISGVGDDCDSDSDADLCENGTIRCGSVSGTYRLYCDGDVNIDEVCDGVDNDCDGATDEDLGGDSCNLVWNPSLLAWETIDLCSAIPGNNADDYCGACAPGTTACIELPLGGYGIACTDVYGPDTEICDGQDNDCDNVADESDTDIPGTGGDCDGTDADYCENGTVICGDPEPDGLYELYCSESINIDEVCDAVDNNCNGTNNEGLFGGTDNCNVIWNAASSSWVPVDLCPGTPAAGDVCGQCSRGDTNCILRPDGVYDLNGCVNVVPPSDEFCDGLDTDCDNQSDEDETDIPGLGETCDGPDGDFCKEGVVQCGQVGGEYQLICSDNTDTTYELCNGLDDDCDFEIDEGNPEGGGICSQYCDGVNPCVNVLDGVTCREPDDDDEPCGECAYGILVCIDAGLACQGAIGPDTEICDGLDNDCDGETDEEPDILNNDATGLLGEPCGTDVGECESSVFVCVDGGIACEMENVPGTAEICDDKDNDCDGETDEDFNLGAPCGTDEGECYPGTYRCDYDTGEVICWGEVGPNDEICDALDNDCDGDTDEGLPLGDPCGKDEGMCEMGREQCVDGDIVCVDEVPPGRERCDCEDNDCDGETDEEDDGPLCPEPSICIDCQCARPCDQSAEFIDACPLGKAPKHFDEGCYCVKEICTHEECAPTTMTDSNGEIQCAPDQDDVGVCVCKDNECTFQCYGVECVSGLICDPRDGRCKVQSCVVFGCEIDELCNVMTGKCEPDLCAQANCSADQACRDGVCFTSCNRVTCDEGDKCVDGECVKDLCYTVTCEGGEFCNPEDGECVEDKCLTTVCPSDMVCNPSTGQCDPDPCLTIRCPKGEICKEGSCVNHCREGDVECEGYCIDPNKSHGFCGASGDCEGNNAGIICAEDEVCSDGACSSECPENQIECDGGCVDPTADRDFCGASGDCKGSERGNACVEGMECVNGRCRAPAAPPPPITPEYVFSTGGGGCACTIGATGNATSPISGWAVRLGALLLLGLVWWRRRGCASVAANTDDPRGRLKTLLSVLLIIAALFLSGCDVKPFCINCDIDASAPSSYDEGGIVNADHNEPPTVRDAVIIPDADSSTDTAVGDGCLAHEICNGLDDDCDGETDEDFNFDVDLRHCGGCDNACELEGAIMECVQGECRMTECDVAFVDLDSDPSNGCEYNCLKEEDDDSSCDRRDNDCDGETDEDFDFDNDPLNCGECGFRCRFPHAEEGAECEDGECVLNSDKCDEGYMDIDGEDENGCEYSCEPTDPPDEVCDGKDNDCDGEIDEAEEVAENDDDVGAVCGTDEGECEVGTYACQNGQVVCAGGVNRDVEVCDGLDNNCDGETDETDPMLDQACGDYDPVGTCQYGHWECNNDELECVGGQGPVDEICDGKDNDCDNDIDEDGPGDGEACGQSLLTDIMEICDDNGQPCGICHFGGYRCLGGRRVCENVQGPEDFETCDNLDNDCDGETDEGLTRTCGINRGECSTGTEECIAGEWVNCTASPLPGENTEICDGRDNDCDGVYDEDSSNDPLQRSCTNGCGDSGTESCSWGTWQGCTARQPTSEVCDGEDNDCDGVADNIRGSSDPIYRSCSTVCGTGVQTCSGSTWGACSARQPTTDVCDGVDNDCDGNKDNVAGTTNPLTRSCNLGCTGDGTESCILGVWQNCDAQAPEPEVCDGEDNDCNGVEDDNFNLQYDVNNCGECGNVCPPITNGYVKCEPGSCGNPGCCAKAGCEPGYRNDPDYDNPAYSGLDDDCNFACTYTGSEVCDGVDNDCNKQIDDGLTTPTVVCNPYGICGDGSGGSVVPVVCCGDGTGTRPAGCQDGDTGWTCAYSLVTGYGTELCDGLDNDCDAATDETFTNLQNNCSVGIGSCATAGKYLCDSVDDLDDNPSTVVVCGVDSNSDGVADALVEPSAAGSEVCDGEDNDCDDEIDEPCDPGVTSSGCVSDAWVELSSGSYIYAYEASRPDAENDDVGTLDSRACSKDGVLPWTNIRYLDAQQACADAGARLCTESEWEEACNASTCYWSFSSSCTSWDDDKCNGNEYDPIPGSPDDDIIQPTGTMSSCYRAHVSGARVYDLSGNVKEWIQADSPGVNQLRGGAMNNPFIGTMCDFDFTKANDSFLFFNAGFRCCHD